MYSKTKTVILRPAALAASLVLSQGCQQGDENNEETASAEAHGREVYLEYCALCHGEKGEGYAADNANALANQDFLKIADDDFMRKAIVYGRPNTPMSAWGEERAGPLNDKEVDDLVTYIRTAQAEDTLDLEEPDLSGGSALRGEAVYAVHCESCHGKGGSNGELALTLNNPWFLATASDGFIWESIVTGRRDTLMKGYKDDLTQQQLVDLVTLIRSWERPVDAEPIPPYEPDLSNAISNPDGPDPDFELREGKYVAAMDLHQAMQDGKRVMVLDVRNRTDYLDGHITGSTNAPYFTALMEDVIDQIPDDVWVVTYCGCPHAVSGEAYQALKDAGFTKLAVLDEGYFVWVEMGFPFDLGE